eukprot:1193227-Prorocentrum_minimum.AAC.2
MDAGTYMDGGGYEGGDYYGQEYGGDYGAGEYGGDYGGGEYMGNGFLGYEFAFDANGRHITAFQNNQNPKTQVG